MSRFAVILPAAGRSSRFGGKEKKPYALLDGRAVWLRTVELFITRDDVCQTLLVVAPEDRELFRTRYAPNKAPDPERERKAREELEGFKKGRLREK